MNEDFLVTFGSEVKALENGHFGGYLIRFSSADDPDLSNEFFTKDTDFGVVGGQKTPVYFNHRMPLKTRDGGHVVIKQKIGEATMAIDETGVLVDAIIWNRDNYEKAIIEAGKKNKLGWSSGTAPHLVDYEPAGKARFIKSWPLGLDASLTPIPCEPKNKAITLKAYAEAAHSVRFMPLDDNSDDDDPPKPADDPTKKSLAGYLNQLIDDRVDDGRTRDQIVSQMSKSAGLDAKAVQQMLSDNAPQPTDAHLKAFARVLGVEFDILKSTARKNYRQTIKGMFADAIEARTPSRWELESTYSDIIRRLATAAAANRAAGSDFDLEGQVTEATNEFTTLLRRHALAQIEEWLDAGAEDDFFFKAILDAEAKVKSFAAADLDTHSQLTVSVLREIAARFRGNHEGRVKAGRVLSEKNRQRIASLIEQGNAVFVDLQALLNESRPMATDTQRRAAITKHLMLKHKHQASIGVSQ